MTPASLHPVAAASFTDILRNKLHSLLYVVGFRNSTRALGEFPAPECRFHFAQTFPLRQRGHPTGAFHWLIADPRPGVESDLRQLPLDADPRDISRRWRQLELAFGITQTQRVTNENDLYRFRFYICPSQFWLAREGTATVGAEQEPEEERTATVGAMEEQEEEQDEVWSRGTLYGS